MGSSLHRLEVLLVGLVIVIAGMVAAMLIVLRPPTPAAYMQTTPQPIVGATVREPSIPTAQPASASIAAPTVAAAAAPTAEPNQLSTGTSVATAATGAPPAPATPQTTSARTTASAPSPAFAVPPILMMAWPWLLLAVGGGGLALAGVRLRSRRLAYTNQNVKQFFAASDSVTHASTMRIVRHLAERGLLTPELAAATSVDLHQPKQRWMLRLSRPRLLHLLLPRLGLPTVKLPALSARRRRLPRRRLRPITDDRSPASAAPVTLTTDEHGGVPEVPRERPRAAAPLADGPEIAASAVPTVGAAPAATVDRAEVELPTASTTGTAADDWTAEDRALAVAGVITEVWAAHELRSPILALDTASALGSGQVIVAIDAHPDEEERIGGLPDQIVERHPAWRAAWRHNLLEVLVTIDGVRPPAGGPLIAPVLAHGRGNKTMCFYPLATWRHLGLYGGSALGALHAVLGSVLFAQPPANVALTILDRGEITPLYRDVAHLVVPPSSTRETLELLAQAIRRGVRGDVRPLLLVIVEPDDTLLNVLLGIATRLQARPTAPVHLIIVQEQLRSAGRELYGLLPALITSGGRGSTTLLPGQGEWPKRGEARLVGRGMRVEGRAIGLDEAAIAAQLTQLRGRPGTLPPVLWDDAAISFGKATAALIEDAEPVAGEEPRDSVVLISRPEAIEGFHVVTDDAVQRWRIAQAITARRQILMDAEAALPAPTEPAAITVPDGAQDAPHDVPAPMPDAAAMVSDATAPAGSDLASGADRSQLACTPEPMVEPAPNAPDGRHDRLHAPHHSRRAALFLATLDAGDAAGARLSLVSPRHERYIVTPPLPAASASPTAAAPAPMVEPDNGWPIGPAPLGRIAMADLMARLVASPAIVAGQTNELGVTKNRIVDLLKGAHKAQAKELAEILMVWFDLAGLMVEPTKPGRLRHPRALVTTNLTEIAARLNATPCPDKGTVKTMWAESNEGKN